MTVHEELVFVAVELVTTETVVGNDNFLPLLDFEAMFNSSLEKPQNELSSELEVSNRSLQVGNIH